MITEQKREEIRLQATVMLDKFAKTLESVKLKNGSVIGEPGGFREEKEGNNKNSNDELRKRFFKNAPNKNDNFILAEKKKW